MLKVIKYRIGINSSNEIFDFSIKELINGLSARRHTVSFFKPLLAASIYKFKLGNMENPIVIDPCAGFGGRLLAFKALYPNGTYIGIEPNIETFNELSELKNMFIEGGINADTIKLYNCTLEEYSGTKQADLTFTSIPYYDLEIYSNSVEYKDFED
jgi:hypothetical protein